MGVRNEEEKRIHREQSRARSRALASLKDRYPEEYAALRAREMGRIRGTVEGDEPDIRSEEEPDPVGLLPDLPGEEGRAVHVEVGEGDHDPRDEVPGLLEPGELVDDPVERGQDAGPGVPGEDSDPAPQPGCDGQPGGRTTPPQIDGSPDGYGRSIGSGAGWCEVHHRWSVGECNSCRTSRLDKAVAWDAAVDFFAGVSWARPTRRVPLTVLTRASEENPYGSA